MHSAENGLRPRKSRRWILAAALAAAALVSIAVPVAWATDVFSDVPNASPHHDDINAIAGAGITGGCAPGLYCPGLAVGRDQMASFLRRGFGRVGLGSGSSVTVPPATFVDVGTVAITVGGVGSATQFVRVSGVASVFGTSGNCPCNVNVRVREVGGGLGPISFDRADIAGYNQLVVPAEWVFAASPGTHTYAVQAAVFQTVTDWQANSTITATTLPFGSTGASTLSVPAGPSATATQDGRPSSG